MVWIGFKSLGFFLPTFDDVFIRRESWESFKAFGEVIGIHAVVEVLF
jgi:hypothetical protein